MKMLKSLLYFFGNVYFAIALISVTAILVIAGTFIESKTGSHLLAARWTYENPFFLLLLSLFFINILFAALRRWPFKKRHIPFLITHLGLLMVISGTMIKNRWGLQGQMTVWEGSGNQHLTLPHSHALLVEKNGNPPFHSNPIALNHFAPEIYSPFHFPQLKCKLIGYAPHVKQEYKTWIKGSLAHLAGFPSIPVYDWKSSEQFPKASIYPFSLSSYFPTWSILALRTSQDTDTQKAIQHAYFEDLTLILKSINDPQHMLTIPLQRAIEKDIAFGGGEIKFDLKLANDDQAISLLNISWKNDIQRQEKFTYALQGNESLLLKTESADWSRPTFTVDLVRTEPRICLVEDESGEQYFSIFDMHGRTHQEQFSPSQLKSLIAYDQGFMGFGVQIKTPLPSFPSAREDKEKERAHTLTKQIRETLKQNPALSPPLQFFEQACRKADVDFPESFVRFLIEWQGQPTFLASQTQTLSKESRKVLEHLEWKGLSKTDRQGILWTRQILNQLNERWNNGESPLDHLEKNHWPFIEPLKEAHHSPNGNTFLNLLSQQIASLTDHLPHIDFSFSLTPNDQGELLSAYFRNYGIDYGLVDHSADQSDPQEATTGEKQSLLFETPLTLKITPEDPPLKLEDCRPGIVFKFQEGQKEQTFALAYDSTMTELKWPILDGAYRIRFQPKLEEIPYRVRLRQARQILYPQSNQTYSYESDVSIAEMRKAAEKGAGNLKNEEKLTLSMNRVHETWDGYRFYLAGIGDSPDSGLKRSQLVINYDPAKYYLTYPGALLVFIGAVSLFWLLKKFR